MGLLLVALVVDISSDVDEHVAEHESADKGYEEEESETRRVLVCLVASAKGGLARVVAHHRRVVAVPEKRGENGEEAVAHRVELVGL